MGTFIFIYIGGIVLKLSLIAGYIYFSSRPNRELLKRYSITPLVCFSLHNYQSGLAAAAPEAQVLCAVTAERVFFFNQRKMLGSVRKGAIADVALTAIPSDRPKQIPINLVFGPPRRNRQQQHPKYPDAQFNFTLAFKLTNGSSICFAPPTYARARASTRTVQKLILRPIEPRRWHFI